MATWKVAPALAAGCAAILKPSELASLYVMFSSTLIILLLCFVCFSWCVSFYNFRTCLELGEICKEVGLPPGVLNILTGLGPEAGAPLASHPDVDKVQLSLDFNRCGVIEGHTYVSHSIYYHVTSMIPWLTFDISNRLLLPEALQLGAKLWQRQLSWSRYFDAVFSINYIQFIFHDVLMKWRTHTETHSVEPFFTYSYFYFLLFMSSFCNIKFVVSWQPVSLELGGKSPLIVFEDVDLDKG